MQNIIKKIPIKIISIIVAVILSLAILAMLAISFVFTNKNGAPTFLGHNIFLMNGTNMEPAIPDNSAIWVKAGSLPEDPVGTVALCRIFEDDLTTVLRVVGVENVDGQTNYLMRSDVNTNSEIISVSADKVVGQAISVSKTTGLILTFITSKLGILFFIILPSILLLAFELIRVLKKHNFIDDESDESNSKKSSYEYDKKVDFDGPSYKKDLTEIEPKSIPLPEFTEQIDTSPKVAVDKDGKAEYLKSTATAGIEALDKVLLTNPANFHKSGTTQRNYKTTPPEISKELSNIINPPHKTKPLDFDRDETSQFSSSVKPISSAPKPAAKSFETDSYIAPKPKSSPTNKTLEELMRMLDKEQDKANNSK